MHSNTRRSDCFVFWSPRAGWLTLSGVGALTPDIGVGLKKRGLLTTIDPKTGMPVFILMDGF